MVNAHELMKQAGLSTLQRPRYSAGLLLEDEDLTAGVDYTRDLMRLMFRSLFGCGVICGLTVRAVLTCQRGRVSIAIDGGLALDCLGNPIQLPKAQSLVFAPDNCKPLPPKIWVTVCYLEKSCRPRNVSCSPDDDGRVVQTRTYDGYEIKLYADPPGCACSCAPKPPKPSEPRPGYTNAGGCCQDATTPGAGTGTGTRTTGGYDTTTGGEGQAPTYELTADQICECYRKHNEGVCGCGCGCNTCVVLATIDTTVTRGEDGTRGGAVKDSSDAEPTLYVNDSMVRRIRPVLTGYLPCLEKAGVGSGRTATAPTGTAPTGTPGTSTPPSR